MEAEYAEVARLQRELVALKDAEIVSQEAVQKEKTEVARLEQELVQLRESQAAATQEALHTNQAEKERFERELESIREAEADRLTAWRERRWRWKNSTVN